MKKRLLFSMAFLCAVSSYSQRFMENLDRGLVAVKTSTGVFTSWRIYGSEYYNTKYNIYRDGQKINESPLSVSNFSDESGNIGSVYTVKAVIDGVEQEESKPAYVLDKGFMEIPMGKILSRRGTDITDDYTINDATAADLDGDGELELIVKRINSKDSSFEVENDSAYCFFEAYKLDGTRLWSVDMGPNIISSGHVETNVIAYDWDCDGKAEVVMRVMDGTIIHRANGETENIGNMSNNFRNQISHSANMTYSTTGDEFLVYLEGATAKLYNKIEFPLKRLENGENNLEAAWGDSYGHRSNKFFFGAPYLNGRKPSLFLARGIYTRHKMIAYDIDPSTHTFVELWRWNNNTPGSPWYGQGYHNYGIADVDLDGRDEIVYGSMIIDDNGKGLSTTGLGHGDAQHCSDLDPYRKGQEIFACLENAQGANYRDATTSKIYYQHFLGRDCGRAMAGNFTDDFLGSQLISVGTQLISSVTDEPVATGWSGITMNNRIYWDGDLCQESLDGAGTEGPAAIYKYGASSPIFTATGTKMNNWTKNNPSLQTDIFGDWREEIIVRSDDDKSLRIYTTVSPTEWRNYTLLHDMQYRQALAWQMCGYNQPPHTSYFLGQAEGITVAPPPLIMEGRVEASNKISSEHNGKHVLLSDISGGTVTVDGNVSPSVLTVNAFSHTEGHDDNNNITTTYTTYTLNGGTFARDMLLVKQGEGTLRFSGEHSYSGETVLWGGVTNFNGTLQNSPVYIKRFAELEGSFVCGKGIAMEYGSVLRIGDEDTPSEISAVNLNMPYGSVVEFGLYDNFLSDKIILTDSIVLTVLDKKNGPEYTMPVFSFSYTGTEEKVPAGKYCIMDVKDVHGSLDKVVINGLDGIKCHLENDAEHVYIVIESQRAASTVYWTGNEGNTWDLANVANFSNEGENDIFVTGDKVIFDDAAKTYSVRIDSDLQPSEIVFNNATGYSLLGNGAIVGSASLTKKGTGILNISNVNKYTGKTSIEGGTVIVSSLANDITQWGALGSLTDQKGNLEIKNGAVLRNLTSVTNGSPITIGEGGATFDCQADFNMQSSFDGENLIKTGKGNLIMYASNDLKSTTVKEGSISMKSDGISMGDTLYLEDAVYYDNDNMYSYSSNAVRFHVPEGKTASMYLDSRCTYTGPLSGKGTLKVNIPYVRTQLQGNWSEFEGTVEPLNKTYGLTFDNSYGIPKGIVNIPAGYVITNTGKYFRIGEVKGSGTLGEYTPFGGSGGNTWAVGSLNSDFIFYAKIAGNSTKFEKIGSGKMTVNTENDFGGTATIKEGELCLNNRTAKTGMLGKSNLSVESGAVLSGNGTLDNSYVQFKAGSTLSPGATENSVGRISFSGKNVSMSYASQLRLFIGSSVSYSKLQDIASMQMRGTLIVNLREGLTLKEGDVFTLWEASSTTISETPELQLDSPGENLEWDTSELSSGILKVMKSTGIGDMNFDEIVSCDVYSVSGQLQARISCRYSELNKTLSDKLHKGIYTVKVTTSKGNVIKKVNLD